MIKILAALLLSTPLLAAQVGDMRIEAVHVGMGGHENLKDYLSLSDDQIQQLRDLRREQFKQMQPSMQAMAETQRALDEALEAASPDPVVIGQLTLELRKHREALPGARNAMRTMALGILDSGQRARLDALEEAMRLQPTAQQAMSLNLLDTSYQSGPGRHMAWIDDHGDRTVSMVAGANGTKHKAVYIRRGTVDDVSVVGDVHCCSDKATPISPIP